MQTQQSTQAFVNKIDLYIDANTRAPFGVVQPAVYVGIIASGDQFIGDVVHTQCIVQETPGTLAVEMEGAAAAQVCAKNQAPFVVLRVISDKADHTAHIDFMAFIKEIATQYSLHLVTALLCLLR